MHDDNESVNLSTDAATSHEAEQRAVAAGATAPAAPKAQRRRPRGTRKDRILVAARTELADHGFLGARISAVAAGAGIAKSSFFHHFADKDALVQQLVETELRALADAIDAAVAQLDRSDASVSAMDAVIDAMVRHLDEDAARARLLCRILVESTTPQERGNDALTHLIDRMVAALGSRKIDQAHQAHGDFDQRIATVIVACVAMLGVRTTWLPARSAVNVNVNATEGDATNDALRWERIAPLRALVRAHLDAR